MEVDKKLLSELETMGFSNAQATTTNALCSGNSNIEAVINWLVDHENDTLTSEMPLVLINITTEASMPFHISAQVKLRADALRNEAHKKNAEQEKKLERDKEKLERRKHGLYGDDSIYMKPASALPQNLKNLSAVNSTSQPAKPVAEKERMKECLRALKRRNMQDEANVTRAFQTLWIYVKNVLNNPDEWKFRKIRISNPAFQERVGKFEEGVEFLELCGFDRVDGGKFLFLPREKVDMSILKLAGTELHNALMNPFFGLLSG